MTVMEAVCVAQRAPPFEDNLPAHFDRLRAMPAAGGVQPMPRQLDNATRLHPMVARLGVLGRQ
jgi:hypothetical protein